MISRTYIDIKINGLIGQRNFNTSLIFNIIHGLLHNKGIDDVGVCFPYYTIEKDDKFSNLGKIIRLVSTSKESLYNIVRSNAIDIKAEIGLVDIALAKSVPEDVIECVFLRDRSFEKAKINKKIKVKKLPYVKTTKGFLLNIEKINMDDRIEGKYNTYGLTNKNNLVTVPFF
jgi:hypothetical protein